MAQIEIKVPDIGDFKEVEVIEVLVKPGDAVKVEQSLITEAMFEKRAIPEVAKQLHDHLLTLRNQYLKRQMDFGVFGVRG